MRTRKIIIPATNTSASLKTIKRKTNVTDVAKAAGVSVATVSRAFNIPGAVKDDLRSHVLTIANSLGYTPNPAAKALRLQKSHMVGVVIPTINHAFFAAMLDSFQEVMSAAGYLVIVVTCGFDNNKVFDQVRRLIDRGADALLLVGRVEDSRVRDLITEKKIPVITTYSYQNDDSIPSIGFDNYAAMRLMVSYLVRLGHKRLVMIAGPTQGNDRQQARIRAFYDTREANNIVEPWHVIELSYNGAFAEGAEAMRKIHAEFPDTTAVVCNSDSFAFGVLAECRKLALRVPEDISVTGHDDQDFACMLAPPSPQSLYRQKTWVDTPPMHSYMHFPTATRSLQSTLMRTF
ncbi:hypothetical protein C7W93_07895 [Glaciimonas sp. PCH181]|nr:LacI family DNA-binding transcriptional regulator [Glaciimonas sp. PCH181]PUA19737.1 hypothetical protein C7W93_07895 [Glaciimonas sp. PCH181]